MVNKTSPGFTGNLLSQETSPYLLQHAHNPVHWRPWGSEALDEARRLDRPVLLSVGYAACHWCHVMAHESFEDQAVADVMNALYVSVKVDREERPDIDQIYMAALASMGEQGGWPLTMFLTPDARPFWGGTYFPKEARYGRSGFVQILNAVDHAWRNRRDEIQQSASALTDHIRSQLAKEEPASELSLQSLEALGRGILSMMDHQKGGLRGAPKFPNAPFTQTLWLNWLTQGDTAYRDAVILSLEKMLNGGIFDHVGGGLARYSTDENWLIPHFEKMLYDNAFLIRTCTWAYAASHNELFRIRIEQTVDWLQREMATEDGAFASSLDADTDGEEGLYYTWSADQLADVLGEDLAEFLTLFSASAPDGWEGNPVLHQNESQGELSKQKEQRTAELLGKLHEHREAHRTRPGRDDKVLTDWNGLLIQSLADAGRVFDRSDWIATAERAFAAVSHSTDADGRLPHSALGQRKLYPAFSSDYAAMINAALSLFQATGRPAYIESARGFKAKLDQWHLDETGLGYYLTASDSADVPMRIRGDIDEAIPSANSQVIEAISRLATITGDMALGAQVLSTAERATGRIKGQAFGQAGIVNASSLVLDPIKLILIEEGTRKFVPVANRSPDPRRIDLVYEIGDGKPPQLADGSLPPVDKPGAWLCKGNVCLPVIEDPAELERALRAPGKIG